MQASILDIMLIAICSAVVTWVMAYSVFITVLVPRIRQQIDAEFEEKLDVAVEVLSEEIRKSVRLGVLEAVSDIPSAEVLRETTQNIAKTGFDIMGVGLDAMRGKRR
jgi:hypothetical protein